MGKEAVKATATAQVHFLIKAALIVGSGGLIFGYDIGVISGTLQTLREEFDLNDVTEGLVVSILYVGSVLGSVIGGPLCDKLGRWKTIQIQNIMFVLGAALTCGAQEVVMLCFGRFVVGVASAISGIADVPYLTEIAPPQYRGILSSQYEMAVAIGILISFGVDLAMAGVHDGWRIALALPAIFVIIQSIALFKLPESPKWLIENGHRAKAKEALCAIYGNNIFRGEGYTIDENDPDSEIDSRNSNLSPEVMNYINMLNCSEQGPAEVAAAVATGHGMNGDMKQPESSSGSLRLGENVSISKESESDEKNGEVLIEEESIRLLKEYQYAVIIILIIQTLSQITGANIIRNYAPTIFENGGVSDTMALVFNLILGVVKAAATAVSITFIEQSGRMRLLIIGIFFVSFGMLFLTLGSSVTGSGNINSYETYLVGCSLVYWGFGIGYGPIPWVLSSEMFPTLIRGRIMSYSLIVNNLGQLVMNMIFLPTVSGITSAGAFGLYFLLNIFTLCFVITLLVETKEITPMEILVNLKQKFNRSIVRRALCMHPFPSKPMDASNGDAELVEERNDHTSPLHY